MPLQLDDPYLPHDQVDNFSQNGTGPKGDQTHHEKVIDSVSGTLLGLLHAALI